MAIYLVTGGAGFIGSHLVERLVQQGATVRVVDNLSTGRRENLAGVWDKIQWFQGDVCDQALMREVVQGVDCIFHQAALASVPRSLEAPLETHAACATGTLTVLEAARRAGVRRVVYAASSSAYGNRPTSPKQETDLPEPISPYGAAKLAGEYYCQAFTAAFGLETVVLRYFNVFGPRQDPDSPYSAVIPIFITALLRGRQPVIYGDGRQSRDFVYVDNVVEANLLAAHSPKAVGQVLNIGSGQATDLLTLLAVLGRLLQVEVQPKFAPPRPGDVRESLADISLAQRLLGYQPRIDFEEGLRRSIGYYRQLLEAAPP
ncbi:MAG: SDR family oxidoreductase [Thermoguttaceae bacterium]|nr:SDR family oxidoreductase [Thermoguttaceae bacterium]MDW8037658.1 SDR family oxidoreductase [Thermoguttaceae bacterium]